MRVLIAGASGAIGRALVRRLRANQHEVIALTQSRDSATVLTAFARAAGAPAPPGGSEEEALRTAGPDAVYYATRLRGASHEKARRELGFRPRPLEWIQANARGSA